MVLVLFDSVRNFGNDFLKIGVFMNMKKQIALFLILAAFFSIGTFASENEDEIDSEQIEKDWKEIGEQGKKALNEAGKFFSDAGKKALDETNKALNETSKALNDAYNDATTPQCYGKWIYRGKNSKTIIECKENGEMSILQKSGSETKKWQGVFTATAHTITFSIKKASGNSQTVGKSWILTYSLQENGNTIKFQSVNIPTAQDGTSFSSFVLFEKYHIFA